jgi:outer membrane receptor protein involved in Fe transport
MQVEDGVEQFFPATKSKHQIVGFEHRFDTKMSFRAEAYQKRYSVVQPRFTNLHSPFKPIPEATPDRVLVAASSAVARGVELSLKQEFGEFSWRGSYALSKVTDTVDGSAVRRNWDQRHALDLILNWSRERWNFNLATRWHSGWPGTGITADVVDSPNGPVPIVVQGERNAEKHGDYFRVDTRISRKVDMKRGEFMYFFEVYNLFDTGNACCIDGFDIAPGFGLNPNIGYWLPRIPSFGFTLTFQ